MKISVITINYNNGEQLEATIQSVVSNVTVLRELLGEKAEYIVIDGGSVDCSVSVLQKYSEYLYYPELEENSNSKAPEGITTIRPDETYPCGIILSDSSVYSSLGGAQTKPVMGIIVTSQRTTNAVKFLDYLFQ